MVPLERPWNYEPVTFARKIAGGPVEVSTDSAAIVAARVDWGRYRLDVESSDAMGPATSVEFSAGWHVEARSTETPDGLEIALDRESYRVGDTARLSISPRFAGTALVAVGAERLLRPSLAQGRCAPVWRLSRSDRGREGGRLLDDMGIRSRLARPLHADLHA